MSSQLLNLNYPISIISKVSCDNLFPAALSNSPSFMKHIMHYKSGNDDPRNASSLDLKNGCRNSFDTAASCKQQNSTLSQRNTSSTFTTMQRTIFDMVKTQSRFKDEDFGSISDFEIAAVEENRVRRSIFNDVTMKDFKFPSLPDIDEDPID